ncbi:MAG: hypothetical protein RR229_02365 [Oscillospiraceae bacterium]
MNMLSEYDIKQKLDVTDFQHLTGEKIHQLATMIPDMNPEVAKKIIEQVPKVIEFASNASTELNESFNSVISENKSSSNKVYDAYGTILNEFNERSKDPDLSEEKRVYYEEKMEETADKIASKDTENKNFWINLTTMLFSTVGTIAVATAAAFGLKRFIDKK